MFKPVVIALTFAAAAAMLCLSGPAGAEPLPQDALKCAPETPGRAELKAGVLTETEAAWFAGELRGLREKPLDPERAGSVDTLRFTWLRDAHAPVVIRADRLASGAVRLTAKRRPGRDSCRIRGDDCEISRLLTAVEVEQLAAVRRAVVAAPPTGCWSGVDASQWIVESSGAADRYRFAQRWSPQEGPIRDLGLTLIGLTGWRFQDVY